MTVTEREQGQVDGANSSGKTPVVFVHGLWLLASSWDPWAEVFGDAGFSVLTPGWPGDPETLEEANGHPEAFAGQSVGQVADHVAEVIGSLQRKPAVVGHSFGGLLTEIIAGRGLAFASVSISPAPFRGVLRLPLSALKASFPVTKRPGNRKRAVALTFEQWRYAFTNAVGQDEAKQLYERFAVPRPAGRSSRRRSPT